MFHIFIEDRDRCHPSKILGEQKQKKLTQQGVEPEQLLIGPDDLSGSVYTAVHAELASNKRRRGKYFLNGDNFTCKYILIIL